MSTQALIYAVAVGAAAIALWLDTNFGSRAPVTFGRTMLHATLAAMAFSFTPKVTTALVAAGETPARKMAALFAVVLPALIYVWLSSIWLLKLIMRNSPLR